MKLVHHLVISDVSTGLLACEVVIDLEYVVGWVLQPDGVCCLSGATCVCGETFS